MNIGDQDKPWVPQVSCGTCRSTLEKCLRGATQSMRFAISRVWREPSIGSNDFFCTVDIRTYKKLADRLKLVYPDMPSSIAPVAHSDQLPVPTPPLMADVTGCSSSS